jgi:uncharacterized iron-regulated membrane protein
MWTEILDMLLAVAAFAAFPFLVIAAAAGLLVLFDHVIHFHHRDNNHGHGAAGP